MGSQVGVPVLQECLRGYNGTILAYGQTLGSEELKRQHPTGFQWLGVL